MNLEGKVLGYDKKIVFNVVYTLVIVLVAFYAGAKYEKSKLISLMNQQAAKAEAKQSKAAKKNKAVTTNPDTQTPTAGNETTTTPAVGVGKTVPTPAAVK